MSNNVLIAQSGGPSAVINASLAGAIYEATKEDQIGTVYGGVHGIQGIIEKKIINITDQILEGDFEKNIELLKGTPAMALGSCRFKLSKEVDENYKTILNILRELKIKYFFYIGGNDSMDTANRLGEYFESQGESIIAIGIPKTIDNDLLMTDHTPGFASAAKFVANSILQVYLDAKVYPQKSVMIVEIMGRNAGWLAASSVLTRLSKSADGKPDLIYLPEKVFDDNEFLTDIKKILEKRNTVVVAVSEGIKNAEGKYIAETDRGGEDKFGHAKLGGAGKYLEQLITEGIDGIKTRAIELNILQRVGSSLTSKTDIEEAFEVGKKAVQFALAGESKVMVAIKRLSDSPYEVEYIKVPLKEIANFEKKIPAEMMASGSDVTEAMMNYLKPLIEGEQKRDYTEGLIDYYNFNLSKTI